MTLPLRAVPEGARVLFIDDFLRGGGTARGVHDLMHECRAVLAGIGVLVDTVQPAEKMIDRYLSLVTYDGVGPQGDVVVSSGRAIQPQVSGGSD
jgi:purine operon repressor